MSIRARLAAASAVASIALGVTLVVASPAAAFTPAGTAVIAATEATPTMEDSVTRITGECPATTVSAEVTFTWNDGATTQNSSTTPTYNAGDGTFSVDFPLITLVNGVHGQGVLIGVFCFDVTSVSIASETTAYVTPDFGAAVAAPASVLTTAALALTVDCGTATADELTVSHYRGATLLGSEVVPYVAPGTFTLGTPASHGYAGGDTATTEVACDDAVLGATNVTRSTTYAVAAPAAPPAAPGAGGQTLAETGPVNAEWMPVGLALIVAGLAALILRRRVVRDAG